MTDVTTPEVTDSEGEDQAAAEGSDMHRLLTAEWRLPNPDVVQYGVLYTAPQYRKECLRKVRRMKSKAKRTGTNLSAILKKRKFARQMARLRRFYKDDGGRPTLLELIGMLQDNTS